MPTPFQTTLPYFSEPKFSDRAIYLWPAYNANLMGKVRFDLRNFISILKASVSDRLVVVDSIPRSSVAACCVAALIPKPWRAPIVLHGEMWEPDPGLLGWLERTAVRLADRSIDRYIVLSSEEIEAFPRIWKVSKDKVSFIPFFYTLLEDELRQPARKGQHIFAGGNSMRDYAPLIEAARRLPDTRFILATREIDRSCRLPENIEAGQIPHDEFMEAMRSAAAVVVPIKQGLSRAAGQQTYLNAMMYGKPTIVSPDFGVRDHIEHGRNGWISTHTQDDYVELIRYVTDPANAEHVDEVSRNAIATASRFSYAAHVSAIVDLIDAHFGSS